MDTVDWKIAGLLARDGRVSNREIGRKLGISEGTVRQRLGKLLTTGALRVTAQVNLDKAGEGYLAIIGVRIDGRRLEEHAEKLQALPNVLSTAIVTGRYDILITIVLREREDLVDFVTRSLSRVEGVLDSETFIVLRSHDVWIPVGALAGPAKGEKKS